MKASMFVVMTVGLLVCLTQQVLAAPTAEFCNTYAYEPAFKKEEQVCVNCSATSPAFGSPLASCECEGGQCSFSGGLPACSDKCSEEEMKIIKQTMEFMAMD